MQHDTAGDPITGVKWSRRTTRKIAQQLTALGIAVSKNTVGRLLKKMDYKLRVNRKQIASTKSPDRNQQFLYIGQQRERFASQGQPIVSVDTKKKELIGNFKNGGAKWDREPMRVNDHDFRSDADGLAILYGVYDTQANRGAVFVGASHDTPAFAVDAIAQKLRRNRLGQQKHRHECLCHTANTGLAGRWHSAASRNSVLRSPARVRRRVG